MVIDSIGSGLWIPFALLFFTYGRGMKPAAAGEPLTTGSLDSLRRNPCEHYSAADAAASSSHGPDLCRVVPVLGRPGVVLLSRTSFRVTATCRRRVWNGMRR